MIKIYKLIDLAGIIAFALLVIGFLFGILDLNFYVHKYIGMAVFAFALIHVGLITYQRVNSKMIYKKKQQQQKASV
jgi:hypothetical protein